MANATLTIQKIDHIVRMKPEFRNDLGAERRLRELTQKHLEYIHSNQRWNVKDSSVWASRTGENGKPHYVHFYDGHALVLTNTGTQENPVVSVESTDPAGSSISVHISAEAFGMTEVGIVIGMLAAATHIAFYAESVEGAMAAAAAVLSAEEGVAAEITFAGAAGPIGIVLAVLAFVIVLAMFLGQREIITNVRYENRSTKKRVKLLKCWTWNLPDIETPKDLEALHQVAGFDVYDVAVYQHANDRKTEGIGLSLLFQSDEGYANICIRNDIHKYPILGIATGPNLVEPKDFYYNLPNTPLGQDVRWGDLIIKNAFNPNDFNNYKLDGIIAFNDA